MPSELKFFEKDGKAYEELSRRDSYRVLKPKGGKASTKVWVHRRELKKYREITREEFNDWKNSDAVDDGKSADGKGVPAKAPKRRLDAIDSSADDKGKDSKGKAEPAVGAGADGSGDGNPLLEDGS